MRLFEVLFIVAGLVGVFGWMVPKGRASIKLLLTLLPVLFGVLQLALEGYRAQMLPAYVFAFGLLGYGLWRWKRPHVSRPRRRRWLSVLAGIAIALYLLVMVSLPPLFPVFQLEKPTGRYAVGTTSFAWSYTNTSPEASYAQRSSLIQCWYPAERSGTAATLPYATPEQLQRAAAETGTPAWFVDSLFGAGQVTDGLSKPFLLMDSAHSKRGYSAQELGVSAQEYQHLQVVFARKARVLQHGGYELTLAGAEHLSFSDFYLYWPLFALATALHPEQAHHIISAYVEAFFEQFLNGNASPLLAPTHQPFAAAALVQYS